MSDNNYLFSPSTLGFYPVTMIGDYRAAGTLPDDVIPVADEVFLEFSQPLAGKLRGAANNGMPCWVDVPPPPPPTPEELQKQAVYQKQYLMNIARDKIAPLQDAIDLDMATNAEKSALTEWRKYRVLLNRVDCSTAPDIQWPEQPE
ncbi:MULTISPECIES: tail fiber assembly protein [Xenorhabdus]|uniref:tail fiber assembly protein n=1 Tax=Xenorhabdus TaxID=626 RepID=UPI00064AF4BE|nr:MULTISPECIES: tail fiber assembly protein [Xenorhabdus]KLU15338.1 phage tail fiber assembly [Xenorhabdus griffiniae]KOP31996.1 phage tail fiber assembly [Xenorhabdus sp. GDc328]